MNERPNWCCCCCCEWGKQTFKESAQDGDRQFFVWLKVHDRYFHVTIMATSIPTICAGLLLYQQQLKKQSLCELRYQNSNYGGWQCFCSSVAIVEWLNAVFYPSPGIQWRKMDILMCLYSLSRFKWIIVANMCGQSSMLFFCCQQMRTLVEK